MAFPETIEQTREDMTQIASRLTSLKFGKITQALQQDVIESLEEMLASLQKALKKLRQQRSSQAGGQSPSGERMIRTLQQRVLRRTKQYGELIEGEQAYDEELLEALEQLAARQERIFQATHDLHTNRNR